MSSAVQSPTRRVAQVRFPGQAAAPPGPVDLLPMYLIHHAFRRDLAAFVTAASATPVEDRPTWRALADRWDSFARILHLHHSGEDETLWPRLEERVAAARDTEGLQTLQDMQSEHAEIDPLLAMCASGLRSLAERADDDARAAVVVRLATLRERLGRHLAHEETSALALVQQHVTPQEWQAMDKEFARHYRPSDLLFALPWVLHEVPVDLRDRVHAFVGTPMVALSRVALRRRFERRERAAFRHGTSAAAAPTPPGPAGRGLDAATVAAFAVLVGTDLAGGLVDVAAGRTTLGTAWGPEATLCAPWPMVLAQAVAVTVAVRSRGTAGRVAAALLAAACGVSAASGFFDGQLARADLSGPEVGYQFWLLGVTGVLGLLAAARALSRRTGSAGR